MKAVILLAMAASMAAQTPGSSVEGTVTNAITGQPIANAHVSVRGGNQRFGALSAADGHFSITPLEAGGYQLSAERIGFVGPEPKRVELGDGDHKRGFELKMTPAGTISGRVVKGNGEPAEGYQVAAIRGETAGTWATDDDGGFRIPGLRPGRYLLRASPPTPAGAPEIRTDGTTEIYYGPTYYPGVADAASALPVEVKAGADAGGAEIRLTAQPILSISGRVTGALENGEAFVNGGAAGVARAHHDGTFTLWRVPMGKHTLTAELFAHNGLRRSAPVRVEVNGANVAGVELAIVPPFEISGKVEGWTAGEGSLRLIQGATPREIATIVPIQPGGLLRLQLVLPGSYRLAIAGLPEGSYIKRVVLGTTEMADRILELRGPGETLSIEVTTGAGRISGTISDANGPAAGALVALFPEGSRANELRTLANAGADGRYSFTGLAPGKYAVLALPAAEPSAVAQYDEKLERVEVGEGESQTKDLTVRKQ